MKTTFIAITLLFVAGFVSAQSKFGILTYSVPANWKTIQQSPMLILEKAQLKKTAGLCKIEVMQPENAVVNTEKLFLIQLTAKTGFGEKYDAATTKRTEAYGTICYAAKGTVTINLKQMDCYFYSITNGVQACFIRFIKGEADCSADFQQFWSSLLVAENSTPLTPNAKKGSSGSGPAAPAPVM
ncbi:MAG: hypothetical protein ACK5NK_12500 [Niabella sp.]